MQPTDDPDRLLKAAMAYHRDGRLDDAAAAYRQVIVLRADDAAAAGGLGAALRALGRIDEAIRVLEDACTSHPDEPALLNNLGNALGAAGKWMAAEGKYTEALDLKPDYVEAQANLGNALARLGDHVSSAEAFDKAATLKPDLVQLPYEAGKAWQRAGRHDAAAERFRRALALAPGRPDILNDLGNALFDLGDLDTAFATFSEAVRLDGRFMEPRFNRANTSFARGDMTEAIADYGAALAIAPAHPEVLWNRAMARLHMGDFKGGFADYAHRWRRRGATPLPTAHLPAWDGRPIPDGHLLIASEQGYGDTLQFARYLPIVRARVGRVTLSCPPPLAPLMADVFPDIEVTTTAASDLKADAAATVMDLPGLLWDDAGTASALASYAALASKGGATRRVGIVWSGNPEFRQFKERSISLDLLRPILDVPDLTFVSLQMNGEAELERAGLAGRIEDPTAGFTDFQATRKTIADLDLIVGTDTGVVHLAGAMGKPVLLLLTKVPDWRWGLTGDRSAWYSAHRLFRQRTLGDWRQPVQDALAVASLPLER